MEKNAILVGRHELLEAQSEAMKELKIEIAQRVEQVNDVREVVETAKRNGAKYIVVQALPLPLLMQL